MTVFAPYVFEFILDKSDPIPDDLRMASVTGYLLVFSREGKSGLVMVEQPGLPIEGFMTGTAVAFPIHIELFVVWIFMAVLTCHAQVAEDLCCPSFYRCLEMACSAGRLRVRSGQRKVCKAMIKGNLHPGIDCMAAQAVRIRVILWRDARGMDVLMAVSASDPDLPELPFFRLLMACKTGCCEMCAFQREYRLCVLVCAVG